MVCYRSVKGAPYVLRGNKQRTFIKDDLMDGNNKKTGCFQVGCAIWILLVLLNILFKLFIYWFSADAKVVSMLACGYAATQLGQDDAAEIISRKISEYAVKKKLHYSFYEIMNLSEQARNKVDPGRIEDDRLFIKKYNSSTCRKLHGKEKFDLEKEMKKW